MFKQVLKDKKKRITEGQQKDKQMKNKREQHYLYVNVLISKK